MYLRFRNRNKPTDSSGNGAIYYPGDQLKQNYSHPYFSAAFTESFPSIAELNCYCSIIN